MRFRRLGFFFRVFFLGVLLVEDRAADNRIRFSLCGNLFVFGLHEVRRQRRHLIFVQVRLVGHRFRWLRNGRGLSFGPDRLCLRRGFRLGGRVSQEPAWQAA